MTHDKFYSQFFSHLTQNYPNIQANTDSLKNLVSPFILPLPEHTLTQAQKAIQAFFSLSRKTEYQNYLKQQYPELMQSPAQNSGLLMAYDFHYDSESKSLKLIEINTNASGYLICHLIGLTHNDSYSYLKQPPLDALKNSFLKEFPLSSEHKNLAIIDENINEQKMHLEFLMYQQRLTEWGFNAFLSEAFDLQYNTKTQQAFSKDQGVNYIYNRYCDFLLSDTESENLRKIYLNQAATLSPHPKEYLCLADKHRLIELSSGLHDDKGLTAEQIQELHQVLLKSKTISDFESQEELWAQRKKYFFKPKQSYGSKAVYRGKGISKKAFETVLQLDPIIQEYCPPDTYTDHEDQKWKYDLRFYAFEDQIQLAVARLYQGQLTNFSTPNGGFANIQFQ